MIQDIKAWYSNNCRKDEKEKEKFSLSNGWHLRRVVGLMEKELVKEKQREIFREKFDREPDNGKEEFGQWQNAITEILETMPRKEQSRYSQMAEEWNKVGCPPHAQRENWKKLGYKFLQTVARVAFQQFGARVIVCVNSQTTEGVNEVMMCVFFPLPTELPLISH